MARHDLRYSSMELSEIAPGGLRNAKCTIPAIEQEGIASMTTINVNGKDRTVNVDPGTPLLWVLRDHLQLTGTKFGCGIAQCGACTVHVDGEPLRSCVTPVSAVEGRAIVTIEGVTGRVAEAVRAAWTELDVPQCGYCQSGQVMSAIALLTALPRPTDADIEAAMTGNVCRCATYVRIRAAIHDAASAARESRG